MSIRSAASTSSSIVARWRWRVALAAGLALARAAPTPPPEEPERFKLGFSYAMFTGINESDAKASVKALSTAIARERRLPADPEPRLYAGTDAADAALRRRTVNGLGLTTEEYWLLRREHAFAGFLFAVHGEDSTETYLVLAHAAGPLKTIADLKGRELALLDGARMSLATVWLEVELAKLGFPPAGEFFSRITRSTKPAKVVLPVFFRQMDACVVTRRTFETMVELNPQVARQVRIVATSPAYTPSLFAFTQDLSPGFRELALREFSALHESPAGQQVLTIFQTASVRQLPESKIDSAIALLEQHAQLCRAASAARIAALRAPPAQPNPR